MNTISEKQVDKLLGDIASIKSVISENRPLLKQLLMPTHFRIISAIGGIATVLLSALYYGFLTYYGDYDSIPVTIRMGLIVLVLLAVLAVSILKRVLWVQSIKRIDSSYTFGSLIRHLYSFQFMHVWVPVSFLLVFLSFYLVVTGFPHLLVPVISIGSGFGYNLIGSVTRIKQYLITGYWLMGTGILPLLFPQVSVLIFLAISEGAGMLLFAFISKESQAKRLEE